MPRRQRHTAKQVFDRLRDECGFAGGYTIIKDYMREREQCRQEVFVPLAHPPGDPQADFGEAMVALRLHQHLKQPEFAWLQLDHLTLARHPAGKQIHLEIGDLERRSLVLCRGRRPSTLMRTDSSEKRTA